MQDLSRMKVLVVDDDESVLSVVREVLEHMGFKKIELRSSGLEGFSACVEASQSGRPFDLVISDWMMSPLSGLEFLKKLRQTPTIRSTPFLFLTGVADIEQVKLALGEGAADYLLKPFKSDNFRLRIESIISKITDAKN